MRFKVFVLFAAMIALCTVCPAIALVLSGGGARGAYQVGVWKALIDLEIKIEGVFGTSAGALNTAAIAMGDFDRVRDLWKNITPEKVFEIEEGAALVFHNSIGQTDPIEVMKVLWDILKENGLDTAPLRRLIQESIDEETIRNSGLELGVVVFSVTRMAPEAVYIEDIPQGALVDYVLASANFPLFKRVTIGSNTYMDGGIYNNLPIEMALRKGFKELVVIDIGNLMPKDILDLVSTLVAPDTEVTYISPSTHYTGVLQFNPSSIANSMIQGYLDTLVAMNILHGGYTYIYPGGFEFDFALSTSWSPDILEPLLFLLERIGFFQFEAENSILANPTFEWGLIRISDFLAGAVGLERLKLYTVDELYREIIFKLNSGSFRCSNNPVVFIQYRWLCRVVETLRDSIKSEPVNEPFLRIARETLKIFLD